MGNMKSLAKDTAIYGVSSIVGRFLNYLLVPLYTAKLSAASGGYGVITEVYAYTALLLVMLTFGMETTFFRFANKEGENPNTVYSTTLTMVGTVCLFFAMVVLLFIHPISSAMGYALHPEYIGMMAVCVAIDSFQAILFAYLRYKKRPLKFAALKLLFIGMNITLNVIYYVVLPALYVSHPHFIGHIYDPNVGVGYAFGLNLFCTTMVTFFFWPELTKIKFHFDVDLMKRMFKYSWPILILGIAGILNQTADKIIFKWAYGDVSGGSVQLGIYGACAKVAMIMAMITQAFRYAYEPLVFASSRDRNNKEMYAKAMKYFIVFTLLAYLMVIAYMDLLKVLIIRNPDYWAGMKVIPIVMAAEILMGIYFNLSFWYKLIDKTIWGAWFSGIGCFVLIMVNILFIPKFSYMACAWGGVAGYGTAMLCSYFVGQKKYPISYPLKDIGIYVLLAVALFGVMTYIPKSLPLSLRMLINTLLLFVFVGYIVKKDLPLKNLPIQKILNKIKR